MAHLSEEVQQQRVYGTALSCISATSYCDEIATPPASRLIFNGTTLPFSRAGTVDHWHLRCDDADVPHGKMIRRFGQRWHDHRTVSGTVAARWTVASKRPWKPSRSVGSRRLLDAARFAQSGAAHRVPCTPRVREPEMQLGSLSNSLLEAVAAPTLPGCLCRMHRVRLRLLGRSAQCYPVRRWRGLSVQPV